MRGEARCFFPATPQGVSGLGGGLAGASCGRGGLRRLRGGCSAGAALRPLAGQPFGASSAAGLERFSVRRAGSSRVLVRRLGFLWYLRHI